MTLKQEKTLCLPQGEGTKREELKEKVKRGSLSAAFALAEAYKWGVGGGSDPLRAARMYRLCCRSANPSLSSRGYYNLGLMYYHGYLNPEGKCQAKEAFQCFLKSAVKSESREALIRLGDMYRWGQYVPRNERVALSLYLKANAAGGAP